MTSDDTRQQTARFRFGIIAPLVVRPLAPGERAEILRDLSSRLWQLEDGRTVRVHPRTVTRWVQRYKERGYPGLLPEERIDKGTRRQLSEVTLARAIELRREDPERSVLRIIRIMEMEGLVEEGEVKRTTLSRALCREGMSRAEVTRSKETFRPREAPYPNALWQMDTQHALMLPSGTGRRRIYLVACIDDYSRHVVARLYLQDNRPALADVLRRAILARGLPEALYCDNGANYRSHLLQDACGELGIDLRHARPYRPQGKGRVERFFGTVSRQWNHEAQHLIDAGKLTTLAELQRFFAAWLESEYNTRLHSATREAPNARLGHTHPEHPRVFADPLKLERAFLVKEDRSVSATGTISVQGEDYEVDAALAKRRITIRFDPYDLTHIHVEHEGKDFGLALPLVLTHGQEQRTVPAAAQAEERTPFHELMQRHDEQQRNLAAGRMRFTQASQGSQDELPVAARGSKNGSPVATQEEGTP